LALLLFASITNSYFSQIISSTQISCYYML
jgi:hypothetical protein